MTKSSINSSRSLFAAIAYTCLFSVIALIAAPYAQSGEPLVVYPEKDARFAQTLNGPWSFKYIPSLDAGSDAGFFAPEANVATWKTIQVPSNWEIQGFAEPFYDMALKDGLGLYRRTFRVPAEWSGRIVCVRSEGVAFGFELWVNGIKIGESRSGGYTPHTFDITSALQSAAGADNVLALKVTTKPHGWEFDVSDAWSLSGIYRDVTLFSLPQTHVQDLTTRTRLAPNGTAELSVAVQVNDDIKAELTGRLLAPDGSMVAEFEMPRNADGLNATSVSVQQPYLWTAETPSLYRLQLSLNSGGRVLQSIEERIGLREVSIVDGILQLNGRPIKLRGVNRHDLNPEVGRAVTEAHMRRDLELMKQGNINYVRMSHYPSHPRFAELCDELGFYVMCEVPVSSKGKAHLNDPAYRDNILARVEPTITRDKNRASVIIWSIGNENPITEVEMAAGRLTKQLDPTRPICMPRIGSYFGRNYQRLPDYVDIYSPHYPTNKTVSNYATKLDRPIVLTEYGHAFGLATDRIQAQWEIMQASPRYAGGSIWHFMDQGILRHSDKPINRDAPTNYVWLDDRTYFETNGFDGMDGIMYAERTPQIDYWLVRKVYAPVQIAERTAEVKTGKNEINLTIENRYDFRTLSGMTLAWSLQRNNHEIEKGASSLKAAAHQQETVRIPVTIPADATTDILTLDVRCLDESGLQLNERTVRLNVSSAATNDWTTRLPKSPMSTINENPAEVTISQLNWTIKVNRTTGDLTLNDNHGQPLIAGIGPHAGRNLTLAEKNSTRSQELWRAPFLALNEAPKIAVTRDGAIVCLSVSGSYPRTDMPSQAFIGGYTARIAPNGVIEIRYDYALSDASGFVAEAGLSLALPAELSEFRWIGEGPYAGYPGKDRQNEFGIFHLNRDDLRFQGNRRATELTLLTTPAGAGIALISTPSDISVDRAGKQTRLSHNVVISGLGNKYTPPETIANMESLTSISGSFTIVPLASDWPEPLKRYFGKPAGAREVFRPYYHSYDQ